MADPVINDNLRNALWATSAIVVNGVIGCVMLFIMCGFGIKLSAWLWPQAEQMTTEKLISVITLYQDHTNGKTGYEHLNWMTYEVLNNIIPEGKIDKAMRWLGFIQGVLHERKDFTLEELKAHSRS